MSQDFAKLLLQVVGVIFGGGTLQLLIFIIKKRASLRSLDKASASDPTQLTSANDFIMIQSNDIKELRKEIKSSVEALRESEETVNRLTGLLARARSDLAIAGAINQELGLDPPSRPSRHRREESGE